MTRLSPLELRVMEALWKVGPASIRELQQTFPAKSRPAYSTVQTIVYRLENKKAVRRAKKISNAHIFEAVVARSAVHRRLIRDFLALFDGRTQPLMAGLIESGRLTFDDIEDAERMLQQRTQERATP
jgi:BlaI family transcriptional regulator, penicillinase repressor